MRALTMTCLALASLTAFGQGVKDRYTKYEYRIAMRDGTKLYTSVYVPKNKPGKHPILMERTPYGAGPYGPDNFRGPRGSAKFQEAGFIFAYQDVRGIHMSEGDFEDVRPQLQFLTGKYDVDESTVRVIDPTDRVEIGRDAFELMWKGKALLIANEPVTPPRRSWVDRRAVVASGAVLAVSTFALVSWRRWKERGMRA
jgi:hypothetical protein